MRKIAALFLFSAFMVSSAWAVGKFTFCAPEGQVWVSSARVLEMSGTAQNLRTSNHNTEFSFTCSGTGTCYKISEGGKKLEIWGTIMQGRGIGTNVVITPVNE